MQNFKVIEPLVYFELFDYPLTAVEAWQYQRQSSNLAEVINSLTNLKSVEGYYLITDRPELVATRKERYLLAEQKLRKRGWVLKILANLPFVRMIAICNSLAYNNSRAEGDIDLFIITTPGKIWTSRCLANLFLWLFNLRPKTTQTQDKLCLSFWVTADNLNLQPATLGEADIYFQYWLATLWPIYDAGGYYTSLVRENVWLKKFLPNWSGKLPPPRRRVNLGAFGYFLKKLGEKLLVANWLEKLIRERSLEEMPKALTDLANQDTRVLINEQMLKLHTKDRRQEYQDKYQQKLASLYGPQNS
ncbi:MAG: hypothetical protein WCW02_01555 [Candidatus Buchananbacteria bacterium]